MKFSKLALLALVFLVFSCKKDDPDPVIDNDCRYKFAANLADIYGAWEPKQVINLETGDTTNYAKGEGHTGFMFAGLYADSFELRPDSTMSTYYVNGGRHCKTRVDGIWYTTKDTIFISGHSRLLKLPVISLSKTELIVNDTINFKFSKATYRKNNQ